MYQQVIDPVGSSLGWSALVAAIPLLALFTLLGVVRMRAWLAALFGLSLTLLVAVVMYGMPAGQAFNSALEGAAFGLFPAMWIVVNAIWIYRMTVASGHFDVARRAFARVSDDQRVQGIIIAFSFGALLEALAGFGTPVAICSVMLIAVGLPPLKAATVALIANTAPVAYGAVGLPVITLARVTGLPLGDLSAMTGRQVPVLALFVPLALLVVLDGRRGVREAWPAALTCGVSFAAVQYLMANHGPMELTDVAAALVSAGAVLLLLRVWRPREGMSQETTPHPADDSAGTGTGTGTGTGGDGDGGGEGAGLGTAVRTEAPPRQPDTRIEVVRAFAPYAVIIALFSVVSVSAVRDALARTTAFFAWPGLHIASPDGKPLALVQFKFDWLAGGGTVLLVAGLVTAVVLRVPMRQAATAYGHTLHQLRTAAVTVTAVLALAYVMNASGQTATMGALLARAGSLFPLLSPVLGWFGTAVTGSDTSSNSLFGALQVSAAEGSGHAPVLTAAANTSGGVLGKMISPQNLAIGAAAVGLAGREGELFRRVLAATAVFVPFLCVLVYLQSTPLLSWMVP
ncbi:L-lactate permease [Streptomyces malaysiensis subsp. malaysiensis]|uniref:L-lactate permease n=1 Tax=Streptomyces malaysiensis TaxID=92644 RepID=UPI000BFDDA04|nr:L-lactate permease [Streptomyces malaysiensis]ATL81560.1 L-lactate permease [Streptomyces malaysiensis]QDL73991.1 L-lactate permease [Streptomyces malaysiensis]